jgi:hypothetical protein
MQRLLEWTLERIRSESSDFSWMEEFRFEWTPLTRSAIVKLLEGQSMLLLTDERRVWFKSYVLSHINDPQRQRPFLPVYDMRAIFPNLPELGRTEDMELMEDMFSISFPNGYFIWYIGDGEESVSKFPYRNEESLLWLIDRELPESFQLRGSDPLLDIKLLQLYKLFDQTLEAALFAQLDMG